MRKTFTFSRLAAFLLTVMMILPWQAFAEEIELNLKVGEIYSGDLTERIFKGPNAQPFLDGSSDGNVYIFPIDLGTDEFEHNQYKIGNIYAQRTGTSYIKIQPETVYDEWGNAVEWPVHTITVNVSGNYVTAAASSDEDLNYPYEPDPAVLHDLTLAPGASAYNWMKLVYVWSASFMYGQPQSPETFIREWMAVPAECVTITSSDPNIVEVSNGQFIARGTDGQYATITMSCAPNVNNSEVPTGSVSFTVNIDGSAAVEKEDIDMYFQDYDYSTYQDVRISEFEMIKDETGYYESHTIEFKWSLPGVPNVSFASSDDQSLEVYANPDTDNDRYLVSFYPTSHGNFTVTATFDGDAQYNPAIATLDVSVINGRYSFAKDLVFKKQSDPSSPYNPYDVVVEHLEMTEGQTILLPELCHRYDQYRASHTLQSQSTARGHFVAPWLDPSCQDVGCAVDVEHITAVAAGRDTLLVNYRFYSDEPLTTVKLPIRISPLVQPIANNTETSFDFGYTNPGANEELIFSSTANDTYNSTSGQLEISTTLNPSQVETFIDRNAAGTEAWLNELQGSLTVNLPAGQGTLFINCYADPNFVFKVKIRGKEAVTISQTAMGIAQVDFDLVEPTAVIIYLTGAGGYAPAPKRAPAAKAESAKGFIKSISIAPRLDVVAKQDPDNAGDFYSTFFDSSRRFTLPAGTEAYVATISGEDMIMNKVVNGGEVLPANTPVILKSNSASLSLTPTDDAAVTISAENALHGVDEATAAPDNCYVLSGKSADNSVTGVGFYQFSGTLAAHKAYITVSGGVAYAPRKLRFVFNKENTATGIENTSASFGGSEKRLENGQLLIIKDGVRYNAQGQIVK
ncbi:MAG: hypothetical protein IJV28_01475 [Paludibacteraceae bacterium]|nr:hypothetical protein [Paludibacteraceae bacterium]